MNDEIQNHDNKMSMYRPNIRGEQSLFFLSPSRVNYSDPRRHSLFPPSFLVSLFSFTPLSTDLEINRDCSESSQVFTVSTNKSNLYPAGPNLVSRCGPGRVNRKEFKQACFAPKNVSTGPCVWMTR